MRINEHKITKQQRTTIFFAQQLMAILGCFYFCTALVTCGKNLNGPFHLKKNNLRYYRTSQFIARDDNDLDRCLCEVKKALQDDTAAIDFLVKRGKAIDAKRSYEPGSLKVAIVKNSQGNISLILEYERKGKLSFTKQSNSDEESITLIVASLEEESGSLPSYKETTDADAPPSYEEATDSDALPCYQKATKDPFYISFIKQLIKYKLDLNSWNAKRETLLTEIITNGSSENQITLLRLFLKAGANPNGLNRKKKAPLALISRIKKIEDRKKIVKLLIEYGGNPLLDPTDKNTAAYVREVVIGQIEKIHLTLNTTDCSKVLTEADAKLSLFFTEKYNGLDTALSEKAAPTCIVCSKKERTPTTIQIPSCGHYVHGSCLVRALITTKPKGKIKWLPRPSYMHRHLCPCCKKDIAQTFIKDLNQFYEGIKFEHKPLTLALRILFLIPCLTIVPGGFVLAAGLFMPIPDR